MVGVAVGAGWVGDGVSEGVGVPVGVGVGVAVDVGDAVGEGDGLAPSADTGCGVASGDRPQPAKSVAAAPRPASRMKSRRVRPGMGCGLMSIQ
jgi:hypothetical protein